MTWAATRPFPPEWQITLQTIIKPMLTVIRLLLYNYTALSLSLDWTNKLQAAHFEWSSGMWLMNPHVGRSKKIKILNVGNGDQDVLNN